MVNTVTMDAAIREKALKRLAGLNLVFAFDVEGKGVIDPVVFARSLKRFDADVFTDESVEAVLKTLGTGEGTEPVRIEQFAHLVQALTRPTSNSSRPATGLVPRSPSCSRHAAVLDDYMDSMICDIEDFREAVHPEVLAAATGDTPEELQALKLRLAERAKQFMYDSQRRQLRPVWEAFDKNKDGFLSPKECSQLVAAYLKAMVPKSDEVVRSAIELGVELSVVMFEKKVTDPEMRKQMREQAKKQVDAVHGKVAPVVKETLERMAKEDPATISSELLVDLDANHDGRVTQKEFEERFVEVMQQVLGPERMMAKMSAPRK